MRDNKDKLTLLAEKLLEREVIFKDDLVAIFGKRPWEKEEVKIADTIIEHEEKKENENPEKSSENNSENQPLPH
ncbi:MAG: hypothetical protein JNJ99_08615 [Crocinitomicaceae bacterium]|nr:hypothetical protein [Crocinitomicaceae bacterium]